MTDVPLRRIFISDFRLLEGNRVLPLDAPIVLLHGPNGTGKTSVLSALELALTGEIRSMRRHDPRYTAHLPFHGQEFATLRAEVSAELAGARAPERMTVGGSRIEGTPALDPEAAQFYAERCYLDQVSLGQLLDLYQYREGKEESALARFVNELLGLEQLDALRSGLADANDFRRLKRLSEPLADAEAEAKQAGIGLSQATKELKSTRDDLARFRDGLVEAIGALGVSVPNSDDPSLGPTVAELLRASRTTEDRSRALERQRSLTTLGGRIEGLLTRPSVKRLDEAKAAMASASEEYQRWREEHEAAVEAWRADAAGLEVPLAGDEVVAINEELQHTDRRIAHQNDLAVERTRLEAQLAERRTMLVGLQDKLADAQERAGSMAEGLASLREHASDNVCPVCDRAFGEVSSTHLTLHIDLKIAELTTQGGQLRQFREQRDSVAADLHRDEQMLEQIRGQLLTASQLEEVSSRRSALGTLQIRLQELQPAIDTALRLRSRLRHAKSELDEVEAIAREAGVVRSELGTFAHDLETPVPGPDQPLQESWRRLAEIADERVERAEALQAAYTTASEYLKEMLRCSKRVQELKDTVAQEAERKSTWESRVKEAKRRQGLARSVHDAASQAQAAIVQRVFTQSLNEVWRSVFSRLAPREPFVPAFGIPTSSKAALELTLETVHASGQTGGSPQMMLSAGNLNTAALSLFIALHLAVEPLVPCLVFDDPVQSMDEVHIAQFAGLMRVLSKQHKRQLIIAVHERELFQYLALELSPAFEGDELITIELGARSDDDDRGINRLTWTPDPAIAV